LNPLPLDGKKLICWRLDKTKRQLEWDSGEGASISPGRWNVSKHAVVYASLDGAISVLEKVVHGTFESLNIVAHTMTCFEILDISYVHTIFPSDIPNPNWLRPVENNSGQQRFCKEFLADAKTPFVLVPSVVSPTSWNVLFDPQVAKGMYKLVSQERYALDTRLLKS
jgi:RES domain-containing protein